MLNFCKPWYLYRPSQIVRRGVRSCLPTPQAETLVKLPWGPSIRVNPRETIGRSIWTTGIYELPTTELLFRLIRPGDALIDAGANIGYVSCLMAYLAGSSGSVDAFEPHPTLAERLRKNVVLLNEAAPDAAPVAIHEEGLSSREGYAFLTSGPDFARNEGTSHLTETREDGNGREVSIRTLDQTIGTQEISLLKIDVEGHESEVLTGAAQTLQRKGIRHIVFENHEGPNSRPAAILSEYGYDVVEIGWTMSHLVIGEKDSPRLSKQFEAPNYLATIDLDGVHEAVRRERGWRCLRNCIRPSNGYGPSIDEGK